MAKITFHGTDCDLRLDVAELTTIQHALRAASAWYELETTAHPLGSTQRHEAVRASTRCFVLDKELSGALRTATFNRHPPA